MKIFEITEAKVEMCPEACCGVPVTECKCGPDCEHCDCHEKNKMNEDEDLGNLIKTGVQGSYKMLARYIADIEELIAKNPNHPKSKKYGPMLPKLKADLAKSKQDAGLGETATAGGTSAGSIAAVANPPSANAKIKRKNGVPVAPQKKNKDGTAKNALELGNNLMGGAAVKR
tara:strand:+ start:446 stop:961 length:516 start_codon:yes stop_codon:yes gene_type:complete